jgi:hypothetical protein
VVAPGTGRGGDGRLDGRTDETAVLAFRTVDGDADDRGGRGGGTVAGGGITNGLAASGSTAGAAPGRCP